MTPYDETFLPIFILGCVLGAVASFFAGRLSGCVLPGALLAIGILAVWSAVFIGSDMGYRAWQSMPDPPREHSAMHQLLGHCALDGFQVACSA